MDKYFKIKKRGWCKPSFRVFRDFQRKNEARNGIYVKRVVLSPILIPCAHTHKRHKRKAGYNFYGMSGG